MRALPLLMSCVGVVVMSNPAHLGRASTASALWPIAHSLGATSGTAQVEVFSSSTVKTQPRLRILEREILPRAKWRGSALGSGEVFTARQGRRYARIAYLPAQGGATLVCATGANVPVAAIARTLRSSATPPCGPRQEQVTVVARVKAAPTARAVRDALRRAGFVQRGLVHGPKGVFALADMPGRNPSVAIGGVAMNLAVQITYDNAHGAEVVLATPTIPGSEP
jgi:hypothetical protein